MLNNPETHVDNINTGILYKYALTLVDIAGLGTRTFSYLIPDELQQDMKIGLPVLVPFGTKGLVNAFVVGFSNYLDSNIKAKSIVEILDKRPVFSLEYLKLLEWVANYYCCDLAAVLALAVPMKFFKQNKRNITKIEYDATIKLSKEEETIFNFLKLDTPNSASYVQKHVKIPYSKFYRAVRKLEKFNLIKIENILDENTQKTQYEKYIKFIHKDGATKPQLRLLDGLEKEKQVKLIDFEKDFGTSRVTTKKLVEKGFAEFFDVEVYRNPLNILKISNKEIAPELNEEQNSAFSFIESKIDNHETSPILLYGVTASGKTEVYFKLIDKVLKQGKNVLFLAPEIALASQLTRRLAKRFGINDVAIWHSSISDGERYDVWQKLRNNEIKILAGARSAVFAPLQNIGLIIIDEEHEASYKQTSPAPRYNAKTVASKLAEFYNSALILGSATPDVQTYYFAKNTNNLVTLTKRFNDAPMAKVSIIDMRDEFIKQNKSIFSRTLIRAIDDNLSENKQTMLLMNRRGFSTQILCKNCGEIIECPNCSIPMIWHEAEKILKCHWCNHQGPMPAVCPKCGSDAIRGYGIGTQRVESIVQKLFPDARIDRLDSDVLTTKSGHIDILDKFSNGEIDILIGTQMIAKGLDNPNVTLVGVINSDSSFNLPDYRSSERGFQLLTQVAGRAGRGEFSGKVFFQTYNPDFYAIETAKEQDYSSFYSEEIDSRSAFDYPPFSQILKIVISSENNFRAEKSAQEIVLRLNTIIDKHGISERLIVLGPSSCILERINNEYRFQILIKNKMDKKGHFFISSFLQKIKLPQDIKLVVDIDPIDIL
ncbi:MAG: primosomal protein N' [Candidatus Gastranaerophilales bacterium]|nr:primosomal protein N' [Candidatus Gastranaerophilales bacterium]